MFTRLCPMPWAAAFAILTVTSSLPPAGYGAEDLQVPITVAAPPERAAGSAR